MTSESSAQGRCVPWAGLDRRAPDAVPTLRRWIVAVCVAQLGLLLAAPVLGATLSGQVTLVAGDTELHGGEAAAAIVYYKPERPVTVRPNPHVAEIVMRQKEFVPHVLALTVGSSVRFPNADPILHNVFSVSGGNSFDLGLYPAGTAKTVTFPEPGLVRVFCNVHQAMVAYVLVLDTPWFAAPAADGRFSFDDLPAGSGLCAVWYERAEAWSRPITLPLTEPLEVRLEVTKPLVPPHDDKHGKPYQGADADAGSPYK
jgi:plastocyanin